MMYKKSPFDLVYERGDSVALAVINGKINFPSNSNKVNISTVFLIIIFIDCITLIYTYFLGHKRFDKHDAYN